MNRHFASALGFAITTAAIAGAAVMASSKAYAESLADYETSFVSTRSRAEVRAELMGNREAVTAAAIEWTMQHNYVPQMNTGYTREQARSAYQAAREEVSALTSEDSGSSYFARRPMPMSSGITVAGQTR